MRSTSEGASGFVKSVGRRRGVGPGGLFGQGSSVERGSGNMGASGEPWKVGSLIAALFVFFMVARSGLLFGLNTQTSHSNLRAPVENPNCKTVWCMSTRHEFHFALVADLDRQSKVVTERKTYWRSWWKQGTLVKEAVGADGLEEWRFRWLPEEIELKTQLAEDGRGLELSELVAYNGRLWTFDDRTGVAFELDRKHQCIPRHILMEGDGENSKGQKTEWATEKDGELYVGSFGKPYTNNLGEVTTRNNLWISIISPAGQVRHVDWTPFYTKMQEITHSAFPGYMIHEAIHWDSINRLWYVLPRRVSSEPYDEKKDETMGSNLLLAFNEDFSKVVKNINIGHKVDTHGWSSFKFIPWTNNQVIIALRTMELEDKASGKGEQTTFLTLFSVDGEVFIHEQEIPGKRKYEGIEFL